MMYQGESANKVMWDRAQQDSISLLRWAEANKDSKSEVDKTNALYTLYNYHTGGWCGVPQDSVIAKMYLEEAAKLGHAQAAYDFAREFMRDRPNDAEKYIKEALFKIKESSLNFHIDKQKSMEYELKELLRVISYIRDAPKPRYL